MCGEWLPAYSKFLSGWQLFSFTLWLRFFKNNKKTVYSFIKNIYIAINISTKHGFNFDLAFFPEINIPWIWDFFYDILYICYTKFLKNRRYGMKPFTWEYLFVSIIE